MPASITSVACGVNNQHTINLTATVRRVCYYQKGNSIFYEPYYVLSIEQVR